MVARHGNAAGPLPIYGVLPNCSFFLVSVRWEPVLKRRDIPSRREPVTPGWKSFCEVVERESRVLPLRFFLHARAGRPPDPLERVPRRPAASHSDWPFRPL